MTPLEFDQFIFISTKKQRMVCFLGDEEFNVFPVSTGKNGLGEKEGSECTPRGWHKIYAHIGLDSPINSVFVGRKWTNEVYSADLALQYPGRDWILTRILQLEGIEPGRNQGENVDTLSRFIYIHGTPDTTELGTPGSRGCIRMRNSDIVVLANWVKQGAWVCIE